jgi:tetratricopeptide (TPR) repeat protein
VIYNDMGKYREAREVYQAALSRGRSGGNNQLDPFVRGKVANLYADIGDVFVSSGLHEEAAAEYHRALALCPTFVDIRVKLANTYREKGEKDTAVRELQEAVRINANYLPAHVALGVALYSVGRRDEAVACWEGVLQRSPGNKQAEMYLSLVRENPGAVS